MYKEHPVFVDTMVTEVIKVIVANRAMLYVLLYVYVKKCINETCSRVFLVYKDRKEKRVKRVHRVHR
jgi:hypothetical protein